MVGDTDSRDKTVALKKGARFGKWPLQRHLWLGWLLVRDAA
jgi:hypothetical protein